MLAHTDLHTHGHTGASYTKVRLNRNQEVELKESEEKDMGGKEAVREENLRWRLSRALGKHCRVGDDNKGSSPASGKESRQQRYGGAVVRVEGFCCCMLGRCQSARRGVHDCNTSTWSYREDQQESEASLG